MYAAYRQDPRKKRFEPTTQPQIHRVKLILGHSGGATFIIRAYNWRDLLASEPEVKAMISPAATLAPQWLQRHIYR